MIILIRAEPLAAAGQPNDPQNAAPEVGTHGRSAQASGAEHLCSNSKQPMSAERTNQTSRVRR